MFESLDHATVQEVKNQVRVEHQERLVELRTLISHHALGAGLSIQPGDKFDSLGNNNLMPLEKMCREYIAIEKSLEARGETDESE